MFIHTILRIVFYPSYKLNYIFFLNNDIDKLLQLINIWLTSGNENDISVFVHIIFRKLNITKKKMFADIFLE